MKVCLTIDLISTSVTMYLPKGSTARSLWDKQAASDSDEDWQEFVDYVSDDVSGELDFCITNGEVITP